jgi:hypothetical protein
MSRDQALWDRYFTHPMLPKSFLLKLAEYSSLELKVTFSWLGCLDIFRTYGADILVLGSSEVFHGIIPDQLAKQVKIPLIPNPRILQCTGSVMPVPIVAEFLELLTSMPQNSPKIVLWGYSFWQAYSKSPFLTSTMREQMKEISEYRRGHLKDGSQVENSIFNKVKIVLNAKGSDYFPILSWDQVSPLNLAKLIERGRITKGGTMRLLDKPQVSGTGSLEIPDSYLRDPAEVAKIVDDLAVPGCTVIENTKVEDCQANEAAHDLEKVLRITKQYQIETFIYLTPVTKVQMKSGASCFRSVARETLIGARSNLVNTLVDEMHDYGLTSVDYMKKLPGTNVWRFDENHVSLSGAKKITSHLARWMSETLK